jgi:cell shape-determining protein MreC
MAENEDDIRRVEVGLSFLSGQDSAMAMQFAEALKSSADFFKNFNPKDWMDSVQKNIVAADSLKQENERMRQHYEKMQDATRGLQILARYDATSRYLHGCNESRHSARYK